VSINCYGSEVFLSTTDVGGMDCHRLAVFIGGVMIFVVIIKKINDVDFRDTFSIDDLNTGIDFNKLFAWAA
jgi:hypothetical protein